jgi:hypothetical protein
MQENSAFGASTSNVNCAHHHHHLPSWIMSLDLFRHRRVAIVSWGIHDLFFFL